MDFGFFWRHSVERHDQGCLIKQPYLGRIQRRIARKGREKIIRMMWDGEVTSLKERHSLQRDGSQGLVHHVVMDKELYEKRLGLGN